MTPPVPTAPEDASPRTDAPSLLAHLLTILQVAVTLGLLWWLFHDARRREVMWNALQVADWRWMALAVASAGVCEWFGILRWQLFLRMLHIEVPLREITRLFFIGAFFNQFLPGTTGGDVVRVIFLMRDHPEHKTAGFLSVAIDRLPAFPATASRPPVFVSWPLGWASRTSHAAGGSHAARYGDKAPDAAMVLMEAEPPQYIAAVKRQTTIPIYVSAWRSRRKANGKAKKAKTRLAKGALSF